MAEKFDDIFAVSEDKRHHFINLHQDQIENYIDWFELDFYGVPIDISDEKYNEIFEGDYTNAIHIGKLTGCLILCRQMLDDGEDPAYICDSIDYRLDLTISCLSGPTEPLNEEPFQDIFYIEELEMDEKYDNENLKITILKSLPKILLNLKNICPELLVNYPMPNIMNEKQIDYLLCKRNSYPESAKDIPLWDLYQKAGFIESGNSKMLFMKTY